MNLIHYGKVLTEKYKTCKSIEAWQELANINMEILLEVISAFADSLDQNKLEASYNISATMIDESNSTSLPGG